MFSSIADQFDLPTNRLYQIRDDLIRRHIPLTDLVSGNVNAQGIIFPPNLLQKALAAGAKTGKIYRPDPLGQPAARQAISRLYAREGLKIPVEQILLTPGTSTSYWYVFKLLAEPGDEILAPIPSYPLFDSIAALGGVKLVPYRLREAARWEIDFEDLEAAITPRTKAIILISPHNPTGAVATEEEVQQIGEIASRRGITIITDEVFSSFVFTPPPRRKQGPSGPLVITMNGLSKMLALPGMKIGWMTVTGDPALVKKAMKTLEMISDAFLPVNEAAQFALSDILRAGSAFQKSYVVSIRDRLACAVKILDGQPSISFIKPEGGFFLTMTLNGKGAHEEDIACRLLQKHHILVHPGYFYDMEGQHLVISFVCRPPILRRALKILIEQCR